MKKAIILFIILFLSISTVFAFDNYIGANIGYSWATGNLTTNVFKNTSATKITSSELKFGAMGVNYFTNLIGIGYSIGGGKTLTYKANNVDSDVSDFPLSFNIRGNLLFKYDISSLFALYIGLGLDYNILKRTIEEGTSTFKTLSGDLKLGFIANLNKSFAILGGVDLLYPFTTELEVSSSFLNLAFSVDKKIFTVEPYLAMMFRY